MIDKNVVVELRIDNIPQIGVPVYDVDNVKLLLCPPLGKIGHVRTESVIAILRVNGHEVFVREIGRAASVELSFKYRTKYRSEPKTRKLLWSDIREKEGIYQIVNIPDLLVIILNEKTKMVYRISGSSFNTLLHDCSTYEYTDVTSKWQDKLGMKYMRVYDNR